MANKILVTGGLGYIGSHTVVALADAGFEPVIADNLSNSNKNVLDRIEKICQKTIAFYEIDIANESALIDCLKKENIQAVIHFAAYKAVGESVLYPLKYYKNNLGGLISLLSCMQQQNIRNLIFSSSCTVYGEPDFLPVTEHSLVKLATSPYGATKQMGENIIKDTKISSIALRYFNPIGAHESAIIGEMPLGVPNNLVPYITQSAIGMRGALVVNGNDYPTKDGTNIRDYVHVMDLAEAHLAALKYQLATPKDFEVFNIGTGKGNSVLEIINTFEKINSLTINYSIGPRREGDVVAVWADVEKAANLLGWKAKRTLAESLKSAWQWEQYAANL